MASRSTTERMSCFYLNICTAKCLLSELKLLVMNCAGRSGGLVAAQSVSNHVTRPVLISSLCITLCFLSRLMA